MTEDEYLSERLEDQIRWYSKKSQANQKYYKRLRLVEIVCASLIPFLAGIGNDLPYSKWIIGNLGVIIAISAGASSLYKFQENWTQYRTTAEALKQEKYLYLTEASPYHEDNKFLQLVERVESLISSENTQWALYTKQDKQSALNNNPKNPPLPEK